MIADRVFGLVATVAFVLGIIDQIELLSFARPATPFTALDVTFFALALIATGYAYYRSEMKYGVLDRDYEVDFFTMAFSLPAWAIAISAAYFLYVVFLVIAVHEPSVAALPDELFVLRDGIRANGMLAVFVALFTLQSFVIAVYFLIREPIKEFR